MKNLIIEIELVENDTGKMVKDLFFKLTDFVNDNGFGVVSAKLGDEEIFKFPYTLKGILNESEVKNNE